MSDTVPAPAFMDDAEIKAPRSHVAREHEFQRVVVAFIHKAVMPPMFVTAISHENEMTQNARARARSRGVLPGIHDLYVCQAPRRSAWLELKWGKNQPSDAQLGVADALWKCGIDRGFCWSMQDVLRELRDAGMRLHGNADNLATEYQARAEAAIARAEAKPPRKATARPRVRRGSPGQYARIQAARYGL